jgi:hypothetical protein
MGTQADIPARASNAKERRRAIPRRVGAVGPGIVLAALIASAIVTALFLTARSAVPSSPVDTAQSQRIWLIGMNDPARLEAFGNSVCTFEGSRYRSAACRPSGGPDT